MYYGNHDPSFDSEFVRDMNTCPYCKHHYFVASKHSCKDKTIFELEAEVERLRAELAAEQAKVKRLRNIVCYLRETPPWKWGTTWYEAVDAALAESAEE